MRIAGRIFHLKMYFKMEIPFSSISDTNVQKSIVKTPYENNAIAFVLYVDHPPSMYILRKSKQQRSRANVLVWARWRIKTSEKRKAETQYRTELFTLVIFELLNGWLVALVCSENTTHRVHRTGAVQKQQHPNRLRTKNDIDIVCERLEAIPIICLSDIKYDTQNNP